MRKRAQKNAAPKKLLGRERKDTALLRKKEISQLAVKRNIAQI
jgi:hypothetical protein